MQSMFSGLWYLGNVHETLPQAAPSIIIEHVRERVRAGQEGGYIISYSIRHVNKIPAALVMLNETVTETVLFG